MRSLLPGPGRIAMSDVVGTRPCTVPRIGSTIMRVVSTYTTTLLCVLRKATSQNIDLLLNDQSPRRILRRHAHGVHARVHIDAVVALRDVDDCVAIGDAHLTH